MNELIALVASKTGWTLEYIRSLPIETFNALVEEFGYQLETERYTDLYGHALVVCTLANSKTRKYKPKDIIGEPPKRRVKHMDDNLGKTPEIKMLSLGGKEYEVGPITLNILCDLEDAYKEPFSKIFDGRIKPVRTLLYLLLRGRYPEITEQVLGDLLTTDALAQARKTIGI